MSIYSYAHKKCRKCLATMEEKEPFPTYLVLTTIGLPWILAGGLAILSGREALVHPGTIAFLIFLVVAPMFFVGFPFIRRNVIGRYVWAFYDKQGELHVHEKLPKRFNVHPSDWEQLPRHLRLRIGGWFLQSRSIGAGVSNPYDWTIESWDGWFIDLRRGTFVFRLDDPKDVIWITENVQSPEGLLLLARQTKQLQREQDDAREQPDLSNVISLDSRRSR